MNYVNFDSLYAGIDKVYYTIRHINYKSFAYLRKLMELKYGSSKPIRDKKTKELGLQFINGIYLTYPSNKRYNWARIDIRPNLHRISDLVEILLHFPNVMDTSRKEDEAFQNIKSLEIYFDLPIPPLEQRGNELVAAYIKNYIIPRIPKRCFFIKFEDGDNYNCTDGAINGSASYYFHSVTNSRLLTKINPNKNHRGSECIIYTKYDPEYEIWTIRFEIRIKNKKVKEMLGFSSHDLPNDLFRILMKAEEIKFKENFYFVNLEYEKFLNDKASLITRETEPSFKWLKRQGCNEPPAHQLMIMNRIEKLFAGKKQEKKPKDYIEEMSFKSFEKKLNNYIDSLIKNGRVSIK